MSTLFTVSLFPVMCNLLYLEPDGRNKHAIALCNLFKSSAFVTHLHSQNV